MVTVTLFQGHISVRPLKVTVVFHVQTFFFGGGGGGGEHVM